MNGERGLIVAGAVLALLTTAGAALVASGHRPGDGSARSRDSGGWLAARRYLEARGGDVTLLDRPLEDADADAGVWVLAFPFPSPLHGQPGNALHRQLRAGGHVLLAYSGRTPGRAESFVAEALGLEWERAPGDVPLHTLRWRRYAAEEWLLTPEPVEDGPPRSVRIGALRYFPRPPAEASVLARDAQGRPAAFSYRRARGRVVVLPADTFSNARLAGPGNADLLERLRHELGPAWTFDEFDHGLRAATAGGASTVPQRIVLLYLLQIVFVYAMIAIAVARRFGPAWREPAAASASVAAFLLGLGALHHRLGHHRAAERVLRSRARELDGRLALPPPLRGTVGPGDLLDTARRVGRAQSGRRKTR